MFAHKIIEDMDRLIQSTGNKAEYSNYSKIWIEVKSLIRKSQKFHIGDYWAIQEPFKKEFKKKRLLYDDAEHIRLPFKYLFIDYFFGGPLRTELPPGKHRISKGAVLAIENKPNYWIVYEFTHFKDEKKWHLEPFQILVGIGVDLDEVLEEFSPGEYPNNLFCNPLVDSINPSTHSQDDLLEDARTGLQASEFLVKLLNCKNIIKEKAVPGTALNKKRKKKGKEEIFSYYTLKVNVPILKKDKKSSSGNGNFKRIHLCRGHFKEFTKEKPLFGRHAGLYWWQPHVKGRNKKGMVLKDYEVCPTENPELLNPEP